MDRASKAITHFGPFLILALFAAVVSLACVSAPTALPALMLTLPPPATATPEPTVTPEPTATPTLAPPTYTPRPISGAITGDPASHTEDYIARSVSQLLQDFLSAILAEPEPDLPAALATFRVVCQADATALLGDVDTFRALFGDSKVEANVLAVSKLEDGQAVVLVQLLVNDAPVTQPVRYLYVFEDGRWLDNECPAR